MSWSPGTLVVVGAVTCLAACGSRAGQSTDAATEVPTGVDPRAAICAEVEAGTTVEFATVQTIFTQNCVPCHTLGNDLNLMAGVAWADLVNHAAPPAEACGGTLVVPGNPTASYIYQKLTSASPCSGTQMPRGEFVPNPLPACVINIIETWIAEGAPGGGTDAGSGG